MQKIYISVSVSVSVENWRKCFEFAKGEYVLILWSDDLISPNFLSKTVNFLENSPTAGFVYTLTNIFITKERWGQYFIKNYQFIIVNCIHRVHFVSEKGQQLYT